MAISLNDSTPDVINRATHITSDTTNISFGCWINPNNIGNYEGIFYNGVAENPGNQGYGIWLDSSGKLAIDIVFVASITATTVLSAGTWYHVLATRGSSTWNIYVNGSSENTGTNNPNSLNSSSDTTIGARKNLNSGGGYQIPFDGIVAEAAFWNRELSSGEAAALAKGLSPAFFSKNLLFYKPLIRGFQDKVDNGSWSTGGSASAHPRIIYPSRVLTTLLESGSTAYTKDLSDSIIIVSSALKSTSKPVSDGISITSSLDYVSTLLRSLSDSIVINSSIVRSAQKALSDAISLTGSIALRTYKALSESIVISDIMTKISTLYRSLSDSIIVSSSIARSALKSLQDSISTTSSAIVQLAKSLSDNINISSSVESLKLYVRNLSDSLSLSSSITTIRVYFRELSDGINLSSSIESLIDKAGDLAQKIKKILFPQYKPEATFNVDQPEAGFNNEKPEVSSGLDEPDLLLSEVGEKPQVT